MYFITGKGKIINTEYMLSADIHARTITLTDGDEYSLSKEDLARFLDVFMKAHRTDFINSPSLYPDTVPEAFQGRDPGTMEKLISGIKEMCAGSSDDSEWPVWESGYEQECEYYEEPACEEDCEGFGY